MRIQEILDSTRAWEHLRGNDIDAIMNSANALYGIVPPTVKSTLG